jgi:DNA-binding transcriptional MerR regulator
VSGGLNAGAVARQLGVAVTTLRTWHQRYGLGPTLHEPGQHRRYTPSDISRLELMQRLITNGVSPGEAARWVSRLPDAGPERELPTPIAAAGHQRDGGGLALGATHPAARGLARAACRLDSVGVLAGLLDVIGQLGVIGAWESVICPLLIAIGERHAARGDFVDVEHLTSGCVSAAMASVPRPPRHVPTRILLACADEEQHSLPLEALAAALAEQGAPCRLLGARVPPTALAAAIQRTGPSAVLIWSQQRSTGRTEQLTHLVSAPGRPTLIAAAGPGWEVAALAEGITVPTSLADAAVLLATAGASQ